MIEFRVLKKSSRSQARLGVLKTPHGEVETPTLVPVATHAVVKALTSEEAKEAGCQILIVNTFHMHLKPGEAVVKRLGGLHKFMRWDRPLMTDSAGFQVFSLGFGKDYGMGKILKEKSGAKITEGQQPKLLKITSEGVLFQSPLDGTKLFLGPKESMRIQEALGGDIMFAFDECTPPIADYEYTKRSLERTHRWAAICLDVKKSKQALFGVVQGGKFEDLRMRSSQFIGSLPFDGFGIGGEFGDNTRNMVEMIGWVIEELPEEKPRHLLGIGYLEDILKIIKAGVDAFDCIVPTHYARRGIAYTSQGELDVHKRTFLKEKGPLDKRCSCKVCQSYSRSYISHLVRAKEITGMKLLTFHNLHFFNAYIAKLRAEIKRGRL